MTKKEKKKYKQEGEDEEAEEGGRDIKMSITKKMSKLKSPFLFTNEKTQVHTELVSTHEFDDDFILKEPLNKSTQVRYVLDNLCYCKFF